QDTARRVEKPPRIGTWQVSVPSHGGVCDRGRYRVLEAAGRAAEVGRQSSDRRQPHQRRLGARRNLAEHLLSCDGAGHSGWRPLSGATGCVRRWTRTAIRFSARADSRPAADGEAAKRSAVRVEEAVRRGGAPGLGKKRRGGKNGGA